MTFRGNAAVRTIAVAVSIIHQFARFHIVYKHGQIVSIIVHLLQGLIANFGYDFILRTTLGNERTVLFVPLAVRALGIVQRFAYRHIHNSVFNGVFNAFLRGALLNFNIEQSVCHARDLFKLRVVYIPLAACVFGITYRLAYGHIAYRVFNRRLYFVYRGAVFKFYIEQLINYRGETL